MEGLTAQDVKALRNSDRILAHAYEKDGERVEQLQAILTADHSTTGFEQVHNIPVMARFVCYGKTEMRIGFASLNTHFDPVVATFIKHIRTGDILVPLWIADNNTDTLREAGLSHDEFHITIHRPRKGGRKDVMQFWLEDCIAPVDSSARLARPGKFVAGRVVA